MRVRLWSHLHTTVTGLYLHYATANDINRATIIIMNMYMRTFTRLRNKMCSCCGDGSGGRDHVSGKSILPAIQINNKPTNDSEKWTNYWYVSCTNGTTGYQRFHSFVSTQPQIDCVCLEYHKHTTKHHQQNTPPHLIWVDTNCPLSTEWLYIMSCMCCDFNSSHQPPPKPEPESS